MRLAGVAGGCIRLANQVMRRLSPPGTPVVVTASSDAGLEAGVLGAALVVALNVGWQSGNLQESVLPSWGGRSRADRTGGCGEEAAASATGPTFADGDIDWHRAQCLAAASVHAPVG